MVRGVTGNPGFSASVAEEDGRAVLTVVGEVDLVSARELRAVLLPLLERQPVLLDLAELQFLDSSGVRVLSHALRACEANGWELRVHHELAPPVRQVLEMTGMLSVLPLEGA